MVHSVLQSLPQLDVLVTSYDILRVDAHVLSSLSFSYLVLDEGHLLNNPRTRTHMAAKSLHAQHRVLLTGTPVQNHVRELWSLFDLLMPGYLRSHTHFQSQYAHPIQASKAADTESVQWEKGTTHIRSLSYLT